MRRKSVCTPRPQEAQSSLTSSPTEALRIGMACRGARGIVRQTDIKESRIRSGCQHCSRVMGISFCQRDSVSARAGKSRRMCARLVARICHDVAFVWRGESEHRVVQRMTRARKRPNVFRLEPFRCRECVDQIVRHPKQVAASLRQNPVEGIARRGARAREGMHWRQSLPRL